MYVGYQETDLKIFCEEKNLDIDNIEKRGELHRSLHNYLLSDFISKNSQKLNTIGLSDFQLSLINEIGLHHRKEDTDKISWNRIKKIVLTILFTSFPLYCYNCSNPYYCA